MPSAALTGLTLSHFRSYARATLTPPPGPIAVFGPNGVGKTNLLEAISLLSPGRGMRRARSEEFARKPDAIGWRVTARVDCGDDTSHEIVTGAEGRAARTVRVNDKATSQLALAKLFRILWLTPAMDRLWLEGAAERRQFLDRMTLSLLPDHGAVAMAYERAMRERNRLLKDQVSDPGWYGALEAQMGRSGADLAANRRSALEMLLAAQASAESSFPAASLAIVDEPWSAETLAQALADGRARDQAAGRTLTGPHRAELDARFAAKDMAARLSSTGEQKALLISLVLANARAVAATTGRAPIVLLDEVSAHLDEERRAALYSEIKGLGAQTWMTGTGAELFASLDAAAGRYVVSDEGGMARIEAA